MTIDDAAASGAPGNGRIEIRQIDADEATTRIDELAVIIQDAVAGGASVNFLTDVTLDECRAFWASSIAEQRAGRRMMFVADDGTSIVGTALLIFSQQPNAPHRAEVGKMLVRSDRRQRGIASALLQAVEATARERGRTLLMLDTAKDSDGELLYVATGWTRFGEVPDHSLLPNGEPLATSFFYKILSE